MGSIRTGGLPESHLLLVAWLPISQALLYDLDGISVGDESRSKPLVLPVIVHPSIVSMRIDHLTTRLTLTSSLEAESSWAVRQQANTIPGSQQRPLFVRCLDLVIYCRSTVVESTGT